MSPSDSASPAIVPWSDERWDRHVAAHPDATIFHSAAWWRTLHDSYGYTPLLFTDARVPGAALPLMEIRSWLTGRRGVCAPFTDECAALGSPDAVERLVAAASAFGRERGWKHLEIRGAGRERQRAVASCRFLGHTLALGQGETELMAKFEPAVARAIRKAQKSQLAVTVSARWDDIVSFYHLLCGTRKRHGTPPQPLSFFTHLHRHVFAAGHGFVTLVKQGTAPIAGALFLVSGTRAVFKYGASDFAYQQLRGSNLAMWEGMRHLLQRGVAVLDFGRTSLDNEGLRRFKLSWGTEERPIEYFRHDVRTGATLTVADKSSGWHNRIFQRLPLPVSSAIGRFLYPHVA